MSTIRVTVQLTVDLATDGQTAAERMASFLGHLICVLPVVGAPTVVAVGGICQHCGVAIATVDPDALDYNCCRACADERAP